MADEDKEKAEKLAAAKKRFEQLKKDQQKKGKKTAGKKKDAKKEETAADDEAVQDTPADEDGPRADDGDGDAETETTPSESQQSKQRSESFRHGAGPQAEVQELYRKQTARIEELEKENKTLQDAHDTAAARLSKTEDELEQRRDSSSDVAELRTKAKETDRLTAELAALQRQLTQAQQASKAPTPRRPSSNNANHNADISEQLASKTSVIESLELDISNLRNHVTTLESTIAERDTTAKDFEERAQTAEAATDSARQELDALKVSIAFPSDETKAANEDPEALTKRITILESDLRSANTSLSTAIERAKSLEQKIEALTRLHKEATTASQTKAKELGDLRSQLKRRDRPSHVRDASEFELGEDETETGQLHARIRALEAETFDLRRGVWREKRAEMQPAMSDDMPSYEDVDLNNNGPYSPARERGSLPRQTSTFQDVITSGINAFTGRPRDAPPPKTRDRAESMGLMSDDEGFDENAFRLAQEEEAKRRIERIREVKRGLENWKGWRVDIADLRRNGLGTGPVFEV